MSSAKAVFGIGFLLSTACAQEPAAPLAGTSISLETVAADRLAPGTWVYEYSDIIDGIQRSLQVVQTERIERASYAGIPAWRSIVERHARWGTVSVDSLFVTANDLTPLYQATHTHSVRRPEPHLIQRRTFLAGRVVGEFPVAASEERRTIDYAYQRSGSLAVADFSHLLLIVRTLLLSRQWTGVVGAFGLDDRRERSVGLRVTGDETVTVPAGTFDCWILSLAGPRGDIRTLWVDKEHGHVVRMQLDSNAADVEREAVLVKWNPLQ